MWKSMIDLCMIYMNLFLYLQVTSRKQQKEMRDRIREEQKRKQLALQHQQQREANIAAAKAKRAENAKNRSTPPVKTEAPSFVDAPISTTTVEQVIHWYNVLFMFIDFALVVI